MNVELLYWRTDNHTVHRAVKVDGGVELTAEGCNKDDARVTYMTAFETFATLDDGDLYWDFCKRCCPPERILQ